MRTIPRTYNAACWSGHRHVDLRTIEVPSVGPDEVLIEVRFANLCPTDVKKYRSAAAAERIAAIGPYPLGHEAAGIALEVGKKVTSVAPGQKVAVQPIIHCLHCRYCRAGDWPLCENMLGIGGSAGKIDECAALFQSAGIGGCFAEMVKVPSRCAVPLPHDMELEAGSLAEPVADVLHSLERGEASGDPAVVFGLGPMGLLHLLLLRRLAVPVLAVDPLAERREIARSLGADAVLHPADETMTDTIRELSGGAGVQAIFVTAGGQAQNACMEQAVKLAAKKAIVVSFASSTATEDARLDQNRIHYSMLEVRGVVGFYPRHLDQAIELLHAGSIDPAAIRRPRMSLADIGRAFDMYGAPGTLKIGIDVDASSP